MQTPWGEMAVRDAHVHFFLHPYNETPWNVQVLEEALSLRVARATVHARNTLLAGFTTVRDLGTEGAGYADAGLKQAINAGIIPGPRLLISSRAIVATGSYAPSRTAYAYDTPLGAQEADGPELVHAVRDQIGHGADWVKLYGDYRWGPNGEARPIRICTVRRVVSLVPFCSGSRVYSITTLDAGPERMRRSTRKCLPETNSNGRSS